MQAQALDARAGDADAGRAESRAPRERDRELVVVHLVRGDEDREEEWSLDGNWEGGTAPKASAQIETLTFPRLTSTECATERKSHSCYFSFNDLSGLSAEAMNLDDGNDYFLGGEELALGKGGLAVTPASGTSGVAADFVEMPIHLSACPEVEHRRSQRRRGWGKRPVPRRCGHRPCQRADDRTEQRLRAGSRERHRGRSADDRGGERHRTAHRQRHRRAAEAAGSTPRTDRRSTSTTSFFAGTGAVGASSTEGCT